MCSQGLYAESEMTLRVDLRLGTSRKSFASAMFAREIANLTAHRIGRVTRRSLATLIGVEVGEGCSAVAIRRNRFLMNVEHCGSLSV
jgi:hypothetical protein